MSADAQATIISNICTSFPADFPFVLRQRGTLIVEVQRRHKNPSESQKEMILDVRRSGRCSLNLKGSGAPSKC